MAERPHDKINNTQQRVSFPVLDRFVECLEKGNTAKQNEGTKWISKAVQNTIAVRRCFENKHKGRVVVV